MAATETGANRQYVAEVGQAVEAVPCVSRIVSRYGTDGTRLVARSSRRVGP